MAITMLSIMNKVRALLDEYTEDGIQVSAAEYVDMQNKAVLFADMAQKELYKTSRIEKTYSFAYKPPKNLLGGQFDVVDFVGVAQSYEADGAKAYYFEADDTGVVTIDEFNGSVWNLLNTINLTGDGQMLAYKGVITSSDDSYPIRLTFGGTTHYRHANRALFALPYKLARIPDYKEWYKVVLPTDFMDIDQIVSQDYTSDVEYKWERPNNLYFNYDSEVRYRLVYRPIPVTLTSINDTLQCNEVVGQAIVYYVAANIAPYENISMVNTMWQRFAELKVTADFRVPTTFEKFKSVQTLGGVY